MRFRFFADNRFTILTAMAAAAISASLLSGAANSAAATSGLAYDEVMKVMSGDQSPQPGTFVSDFQAAVDAQRAYANQPTHHGLFSTIMNAANLAKTGMAMYKSGIPSSHYYLNNWERTDDPGKQTATIYRPDRHQKIYLNLAKKTYRIEDMGNMTPPPGTPPPYQGPPGQESSPQPGTGKLDISVTSTLLGPKTIDNVPTTGYSEDLKLTATQSTGSCQDGTFETSLTEFVSNASPPTTTNPTLKFHMSAPSPTMMTAKPGCNQKTTMHHSGGATPPGDHLFLWMLMTMKAAAASSQGGMAGGFSTLIERGNLRTLGPSDAGLFDVPSDYTKESTTG